MTKEERFKQLMESGRFEFLKDIPKDKVWELFFAASYVMNDLEEHDPCEKSINKTFEFGNHRRVGTYWNQQTDTVELPKAVFEYILRQVPTEEQESCDAERQKMFAYLDGCVDGMREAQKDICEDVISREAVTNGEVIKKTFPHYDIEIDEHKGYVRVFYEDFYTTYPWKWWNAKHKSDMPSVQPSRKGHWVEKGRLGNLKTCSECEYVISTSEKDNFCPNCGCQMK